MYNQMIRLAFGAWCKGCKIPREADFGSASAPKTGAFPKDFASIDPSAIDPIPTPFR
jgi:hypothetical protein